MPALRGVSLAVEEGEFVAIMGPSGCGKSTLAASSRRTSSARRAEKLLLTAKIYRKFRTPQRTDIRRRKIGFVFQRFNLFPTLTAEGNLKLAEKIHSGNGSENSDRRREVLRLLKLENKMHHKPLELSGGEQQRVALARAIVNSPAIILADEPTGNLDTENSQIVLDMFRELNEKFNQTIIMITHNPEAAANCHRIIRMRDGVKIESVSESNEQQNLQFSRFSNSSFDKRHYSLELRARNVAIRRFLSFNHRVYLSDAENVV